MPIIFDCRSQVQTQRANATWEGRLKHEIDQRHREVHGLQTQVNLHLSQVQQLQATIENVQQKQQQQHHQQQVILFKHLFHYTYRCIIRNHLNAEIDCIS